MKSRYVNGLLYLIGAGFLSLLGIEVALRLYLHQPIFTLCDWRGLGVTILQTGGGQYDRLLGWTQAPNFAGGGFNTFEYGIRKNSEGDALTPNAVLAVGDSFTVGSEVIDQETWPAQVEKLLGVRVLNAGVGGYGLDQSVLNTERLIPILRPRVVILGIHEEAIARLNYRSYNTPKPYFVEENGEWMLKNQPVPRESGAIPEAFCRIDAGSGIGQIR
jgi:hypothetical protein